MRSIADEKVSEDCCGNCNWCVKDADSNEWVCNQSESDYYGDMTDYNGYCDEHERYEP
jgi:hypothetical protein